MLTTHECIKAKLSTPDPHSCGCICGCVNWVYTNTYSSVNHFLHCMFLLFFVLVYSRPYLSNSRAVAMVVCHPSVLLFVCHRRIVAKQCEIGPSLLLIIDRKLHICFQMTWKSSNLDELEGHWQPVGSLFLFLCVCVCVWLTSAEKRYKATSWSADLTSSYATARYCQTRQPIPFLRPRTPALDSSQRVPQVAPDDVNRRLRGSSPAFPAAPMLRQFINYRSQVVTAWSNPSQDRAVLKLLC